MGQLLYHHIIVWGLDGIADIVAAKIELSGNAVAVFIALAGVAEQIIRVPQSRPPQPSLAVAL